MNLRMYIISFNRLTLHERYCHAFRKILKKLVFVHEVCLKTFDIWQVFESIHELKRV